MQPNLEQFPANAAARFAPPPLLPPVAARPFPSAPEASSPFGGCDATLPPARLLAEIRSALQTARDAIREDFELEGDGIQAARRHSALMDALVRHLLEDAKRRVPASARQGPQLAVTAVGGYGRAQLAPASDLDLLFLVAEAPSVHDAHTIEFVLYRLWDLGLRVGHGVRPCGECVGLAQTDWRTAVSLLDLRLLWGDRAMYDHLARRFEREVVGRDTLGDALLCDLARRRARFQDPSAPDVKNGAGGLRDLQTLIWLARIRGRRDDDAPGQGPLADDPGRLLWSVRCHLHYLSGRAEDRLSPELQPEVARRMPGSGRSGQRSTAALMRRFRRATGQVEELTARLLRH